MSANSPLAEKLLRIIMPELPADDGSLPPGFEAVEPAPALAPVPEGMADTDFEVAGCTFIDATNILLDWLGAPTDIRHTALVIAGLTGGDYRNLSQITQVSIAQRMGISRPTVADRLQDLWSWQQRTNYCVVEIEKRDYDPEQNQFATTLYRPVIVRYAGLFVRKLRERGMRPVHRHQAVTEGTAKIFDEVTKTVAEEMPEAPRLVDRKPKVKRAKQREIGFIEETELSIRRSLHRWCDRMEKSNYVIKDHAPQLENMIHDVLKERGTAQIERNRERRETMKTIKSDMKRKVNAKK